MVEIALLLPVISLEKHQQKCFDCAVHLTKSRSFVAAKELKGRIKAVSCKK